MNSQSEIIPNSLTEDELTISTGIQTSPIPDVPAINKVVPVPEQTAESRCCWVCYATEEDDPTAEWVKPCRCRGTAKWVHQTCLQRWVDEKQHGHSSTKVKCPQCDTEYTIIFPSPGFLVALLETIDNLVYKVCPFCAAVAVVTAGYWTLVSYGAIVVIQVSDEGLRLLESTDPLFLLITLPLLPVGLLLGKMVPWEEVLLRFWRKHVSTLQVLQLIWPYKHGTRVPNQDNQVSPTAVSATRVFCGALLFPFFAALVGKMLYPSRPSIQRTILGGISFVAIKGALKVYYTQQLYWRQTYRRILDFQPPPLPSAVPSVHSNGSLSSSGPQSPTTETPSEPIDDAMRRRRL